MCRVWAERLYCSHRFPVSMMEVIRWPLTFPYPPPPPVKELVGKLFTHEYLLGSEKVHTEIPRSKNGVFLNTLP